MKNHQSNIRGKVVRGSRPVHSNKTLMALSAHEKRIYTTFFPKDLDGFDEFWDGLKADLPDFDERLEYLETLCPYCNHERDAIKGRWICPECFSLNV